MSPADPILRSAVAGLQTGRLPSVQAGKERGATSWKVLISDGQLGAQKRCGAAPRPEPGHYYRAGQHCGTSIGRPPRRYCGTSTGRPPRRYCGTSAQGRGNYFQVGGQTFYRIKVTKRYACVVSNRHYHLSFYSTLGRYIVVEI